MLETIDYLNSRDIQGIKLQLLHVLEGTDLAGIYRDHPFHTPDMEEYIRVLGRCIARLRPDIAVHRLTGDGPKDLLIAPLWTAERPPHRAALDGRQTHGAEPAEPVSERKRSMAGKGVLWLRHLHCIN